METGFQSKSNNLEWSQNLFLFAEINTFGSKKMFTGSKSNPFSFCFSNTMYNIIYTG